LLDSDVVPRFEMKRKDTMRSDEDAQRSVVAIIYFFAVGKPESMNDILQLKKGMIAQILEHILLEGA